MIRLTCLAIVASTSLVACSDSPAVGRYVSPTFQSPSACSMGWKCTDDVIALCDDGRAVASDLSPHTGDTTVTDRGRWSYDGKRVEIRWTSIGTRAYTLTEDGDLKSDAGPEYYRSDEDPRCD